MTRKQRRRMKRARREARLAADTVSRLSPPSGGFVIIDDTISPSRVKRGEVGKGMFELFVMRLSGRTPSRFGVECAGDRTTEDPR